MSKVCISHKESCHRQSSCWHCGLSYNKPKGIRRVCALLYTVELSPIPACSQRQLEMLIQTWGLTTPILVAVSWMHPSKNDRSNITLYKVTWYKQHWWESWASDLLPVWSFDSWRGRDGGGVCVLGFFGVFLFEVRELFWLSVVFEGKSIVCCDDNSSPGLCCFCWDALCYCLDSLQSCVGEVEIKMWICHFFEECCTTSLNHSKLRQRWNV